MSSDRGADPPPGQRPRPSYVVGVDGSDPSIEALAWAIGRAASTGAGVRAVAMWHFPPLSVERPALARRIHARTAETLERSIDEARARADGSAGAQVTVTGEVYQYPADLRLIDLSDEADLIVVGRRSRRGLAALGSVSERVASHAHCPVVVVPPRDQGQLR
jgi:nucleotide-binding universal stress UspA family protein